MTQPEQPQPEQASFTTGFDFLNHHLNLAMRLMEKATPKESDKLTPKIAAHLAEMHIGLADVGARVAVAEQLKAIAETYGAAMTDLTGAVSRVAVQMQEDRNARMGLDFGEEPWDIAKDYASALEGVVEAETSQSPQEPAEDLPGRDGAETLLDRQDGPQPPVTRFQQRQAERAAETPPDSKDR